MYVQGKVKNPQKCNKPETLFIPPTNYKKLSKDKHNRKERKLIGKKMLRNGGFIVLVVLCTACLLAVALPQVDGSSSDNGALEFVKTRLFPVIEVTLANDGEDPVLFMCKFTSKDNNLHVLGKGDIYRYNFTQIAFPMRWCYLYVNEKTNGFFWAYNVRLRCTKCFWSINNFPYLYRSDRSRWERQKLYAPLGFNLSNYLIKQIPPKYIV